MDYEEYEVVPASPLKRMEQRLANIESQGSPSEVRRLVEEMVELIKSNQRVIDDVIKSDSELRDELSKIPPKLQGVIDGVQEFISILKSSAEESGEASTGMEPVVAKLTEIADQNKKMVEASQAMLSSLSLIDKRLKRAYVDNNVQRY